MKIKNLFVLGLVVVAALFATSCAKDAAKEGEDLIEEGATKLNGFLAINIKLPQKVQGRGANDDYRDGTPEEYAVDNIAILLFQGTNESNATFHSAYPIVDRSETPDVDDDNITTSYSKVLKVKGEIASGNNLYALAAVNYGQVFQISADGQTVTANGATVTTTTKFTEILGIITELPLYHSTGVGSSRVDSRFFMTNAPLSKFIGGNAGIASDLEQVLTNKYAVVESLCKLNATNFWATEEAAVANPAGNIYVERAVAKVTFSPDADLKYEATFADNTKTSLGVTFKEWTVDNVEKSTYLMRNMGTANYLCYRQVVAGGNSSFRFVGNVKMGYVPGQTEDDLYRTYWCIDPNYGQDKEYNQVDSFTAENEEAYKKLDIAWRPINKAAYPHENTFDVAHQNYKNTSRVVIAAQLNGGSDFWTLNGDEKIYTSQNDIKSFSIKYVLENQTIADMLEEYLADGVTVAVQDLVNVEFTHDNATGIDKVSAIVPNTAYYSNHMGEFKKTFTADAFTNTAAKQTTISNIISNVNARYVIRHYQNGTMYYEVRIKHFANDLAPWSIAATSAVTTTEAYGTGVDSEKNYLGRYGMVRNNWYDINVTAVKHLGSPVVPNANVTTSDDNKDEPEFLAFTINVLSWAKRTQHEEL